ncbi:Acyl-CoA N-acyltransferase [Moelleriella libera RCEF 2490]|uniref:Acyl-CoA N-acyltransferase n=1 Tax=Moelleriella libera RCEF 2490 TaxID=1081109 RepID=A0A166PWP7_9HYPO|nr:Acyl-CoA N-acyltransferase [Moelleriella libera RCEF 2490]
MEQTSTYTKELVLSDSSLSLIPSTWDAEVRRLRMSDRREAGLALAQSFATDPLSLYLMGVDDASCWSSEQLWKLHVRLMVCSYASFKFRGIATSVGPDFDAVALCSPTLTNLVYGNQLMKSLFLPSFAPKHRMPPGTTNDDWLATFWSGTWRLWYQLPKECRKRFFDELYPALHNTKAEVMGHRDNDCYYLGYIGTKANARGRGYASKLLRHMMDKADRENRAMYLESSNVQNNVFYAKFGFEFKKEIVLTRGPAPVRLYCMVREPQNDSASSSLDVTAEKGLSD